MDFKKNNYPEEKGEDNKFMRGSSRHSEMHKMNKEKGMSDKMKMLKMHHSQTLWVYWLIIILGGWILISPFTFYNPEIAATPSGGRQIWLSLQERFLLSKWSDIISGVLLIIFGWRSLTPNRPISLWICCFIGIWLNIAPLVLWAPSAVIYLNDTLTGTFIISLSILIPGMPNMMLHMEKGPEVPEGWSYNPSSCPQRWSMMVLAFLGWIVSRYLSAFQLGYIDYSYDPFFGNSSMQVLNSDMSLSLPISDAGLGALAYTFEFLMGWMGGTSRWRTMPWMVTFFGILVIPLGLVHIFLVISQPIAVGHWCTFCLLAASIMLPMLPLEVDEVIAMGQFMIQAKRKGENFWKIFWLGGTIDSDNKDNRTPQLMSLPDQKIEVIKSSIWGMSFPVTLVTTTIIGIALMFLPSIAGIGIKETASDIFHLCGALTIVVSVISMGEVVRMLRFLNIPLGFILSIATWFTDSSTTFLNIFGLIAGILIIILSIPRGIKTEQYGHWDKYIR